MRAVVDDERGDAELARALGKGGEAKLEGRVGKAARGKERDVCRLHVKVENRHSIRFNLAGLDGAQRALDTIDAVRLAGVTLTGDNDAGKCSGLHRIEAGLQEDRFDTRMKGVNRQGGALRHFRLVRLADHGWLAIEHLHT